MRASSPRVALSAAALSAAALSTATFVALLVV